MTGFRTSFGHLGRSINWYPKHMNTGIKQMQAKLRAVDCILELHDARIPFTGRNPNFNHTFIGDKPHILVFNKVDLISRNAAKKIEELYNCKGVKNVIFTCAKSDVDGGIKKIVPRMKELIEQADRYHRAEKSEYHAMIIGVPNVGKSSLINMLRSKNLRKARSLKVGPSAGVTKSVHEKVKVSNNPTIFLFDTPGILVPKIENSDEGLKLAVCGNLPDRDVGYLLIADYILYFLNQVQNNKYPRFFGINEPCDCITTVLTKGCIHRNLMINVKAVDASRDLKVKPDLNLMAKIFIDSFRKAEFGKLVLDDIHNSSFGSPCSQSPELTISQNETFISS